MQCPADFHHPITDPRFPPPDGVLEPAAAFDAAVDMLDAHAPMRDAPIRSLLGAGELPSKRLPGRHDDLDSVERECQEAQILEQPTARRQRIRCSIGHPLIIGAAGIRLTQKENGERGAETRPTRDWSNRAALWGESGDRHTVSFPWW